MKIMRIHFLITFVLFAGFILALCSSVSADSQVSMSSKFCVNGHCTFSSTGYPNYYYPYQNYQYYPGYYPNPAYDYPYYCSPYRSVNYQGYLSSGQYRVYGFRIGGTRSYIEWVLNGGCGYSNAPVMMSMGTNQVYSWRQTICGADFDMYVYQNRYPCSGCRADRSDTSQSSNAYVGWTNPCPGCYYSVVVYCRSGAGTYDLTSNSYVNNCWYPSSQAGPVMMSTVQNAMSSGSDNVLILAESGSFDPSSVIWVDDGSGFEGGEGYWSPSA